MALRSGVPPAYWLDHIDDLVTAADILSTKD